MDLIKPVEARFNIQEMKEFVNDVFDQGLVGLQEFLQSQDPNEIIDPRSPCGCFLHEYFAYLYPAGMFVIGFYTLEEDTTNYCTSNSPVWYTVFQRRAMNRSGEKFPNNGLPIREALSIVAAMLEDPPIDKFDLGIDDYR